jgi:hypothetical protein
MVYEYVMEWMVTLVRLGMLALDEMAMLLMLLLILVVEVILMTTHYYYSMRMRRMTSMLL